MRPTIDEIKKDWNPDAIYDITGIREHIIWEYLFTVLFPELEFTICWVGRLEKIDGELSSRAGSRLLFMRLTKERFRTFSLYWDAFTFRFQAGNVEMFIVPSLRIETRAKIEEGLLAGKDWLETVYGQQDKKKEVPFVPRTFEELNLVMAREFNEDEIDAIGNAVNQKKIETKQEEIEKLRAGIK